MDELLLLELILKEDEEGSPVRTSHPPSQHQTQTDHTLAQRDTFNPPTGSLRRAGKLVSFKG